MKLLKKLILKWLFTYDFQYVIKDAYAKKPTRSYINDAGYDLYTSKQVEIPPNTTVLVSTGICVKSLGNIVWLFLIGRSSTLTRYGIMIDSAIIDGGYTGELRVKAINLSKKSVKLYPGMRIGQIIPMPHATCRFHQVEKLNIKKGERGDKGFGHTGN